MANNPDGISYFHLAFGDGADSMRLWFNPAGEAGSPVSRLLEGYWEIKVALPAE